MERYVKKIERIYKHSAQPRNLKELFWWSSVREKKVVKAVLVFCPGKESCASRVFVCLLKIVRL
jgi:hypothetical protein